MSNDINQTYSDDLTRATEPISPLIVAIVILSAITWVIPALISARMSSRGYYSKVEDARAAFRLGLVLWFSGIAMLVYFFA